MTKFCIYSKRPPPVKKCAYYPKRAHRLSKFEFYGHGFFYVPTPFLLVVKKGEVSQKGSCKSAKNQAVSCI